MYKNEPIFVSWNEQVLRRAVTQLMIKKLGMNFSVLPKRHDFHSDFFGGKIRKRHERVLNYNRLYALNSFSNIC